MTTEAQTCAIGILTNRPNVIRYTLYASRDTRDKRRATINMQNKPNFLDAQMNLTSLITVGYENKPNCELCENKPKTNPIYPYRRGIKPNFKTNPGVPINREG